MAGSSGGARIVGWESGLVQAGELLRAGKLVAFPTETVYGLGANAFHEEAVRDIFRAKGRPLTDPVIVHVTDAQVAERDIVDLGQGDSFARKVFHALAHTLWPGPLTLVCRAAPAIPRVVCAGGDFVGVRCPDHPVAQRLLQECRVPVAAPSANRFGHVSPTCASHVLDDLQHWEGLLVLDGGSSNIGIESTVVRIDTEDMNSVTVLRKGGTPLLDIRHALDENGLHKVELQVKHAIASGLKAEIAPGQLLTHYAPDVPAFMVDRLEESPQEVTSMLDQKLCAISDCVVLDIGCRLEDLKDFCLSYRDISPENDPSKSAEMLFAALRWSEQVPGAKAVLLPTLQGLGDDIVAKSLSVESMASDGEPCGEDVSTVAGAVRDRLYRACSGRKAVLAFAEGHPTDRRRRDLYVSTEEMVLDAHHDAQILKQCAESGGEGPAEEEFEDGT